MGTPGRSILMIPAVDEKFAAEIGNLVVAWGMTDRLFNDFIERMLISENTSIDGDWRTFKLEKRVKMFSHHARLCFTENPALSSYLSSIKQSFKSFQTDRNLLSHGEFRLLFPKQGKIRLKAIGKIGSAKIERIYERGEIRALAGKLMVLISQLHYLLNPSEHQLPQIPQNELSALQAMLARTRLTLPTEATLEPPP